MPEGVDGGSAVLVSGEAGGAALRRVREGNIRGPM